MHPSTQLHTDTADEDKNENTSHNARFQPGSEQTIMKNADCVYFA